MPNNFYAEGIAVPDRLFIHATNVHQGGGRALLDALLKALPPSFEVLALLDVRMPIPKGISESLEIKKVQPSLLERFKAEQWLEDKVTPTDIVLCFGNLPPLFKLRGRSIVFLQNHYLIDHVSLSDFSLRTRARLSMERLWLSSRIVNADEFIVQTPTMKNLFAAKTQGRVSVRVLPFMTESNGYARRISQVTELEVESANFLYVASGEPHKNHRNLIEAWCLLSGQGIYPTLRLTLDVNHFLKLCHDIEELRQLHKLNVINMGTLSHGDVLTLYKNVDALIYPSSFESFGLPLIEARQAGLPVLASELDYVRDVLDPEQTFDPESPISIARAVKRFLGLNEYPLPLLDANHFLQNIIAKI